MENIHTFLLLFLLLFLLSPCSDEAIGDSQVNSPSFQLSNLHAEDMQENCTAICLCICCGQRTIVVKQVNFHVAIPAGAISNTIKRHHFIVQKLEFNIWQPPKLV